jgi:hypothetical protein
MYVNRKAILLTVIALGISVPSPAFTHDLTYLDLVMAGVICVARDAKYETTRLGKSLLELPEVQETIAKYRDRATVANKCIASREWVSRSLCNAVVNLDGESKTMDEADKLRKKFKRELDGLLPLYKCMDPDLK